MKIVFNYKKIDDITFTECINENIETKKLIFVVHKYKSDKDEMANYCLKLAKLNFHVIAIDAVKHGERIEEPFISGSNHEMNQEFFKIVVNTSKNIKSLYKKHFSNKYKSVNLMGISMGGIISFYTTTILDEINSIIPIIGTPSFYEFTKYNYSLENNINTSKESELNMLKIKEPINQIEKFADKNIFILNGNEDKIIPEKWSKEFYKKIIHHSKLNKLNINIKFKSYNSGHTVTNEMKKDIYTWISDNIK